MSPALFPASSSCSNDIAARGAESPWTAAPPTTFVPADDNLFPPLAHSGMWLALGIAAGLLTIALVVWMLHAVPDADARARQVRLTVKGRYLAEIDAAYQQFANGAITERQLHHELSRTVRRYADEHGAPGALAMTAVDLGRPASMRPPG